MDRLTHAACAPAVALAIENPTLREAVRRALREDSGIAVTDFGDRTTTPPITAVIASADQTGLSAVRAARAGGFTGLVAVFGEEAPQWRDHFAPCRVATGIASLRKIIGSGRKMECPPQPRRSG